MKNHILALCAVVALSFGVGLGTVSVANACDGNPNCPCNHKGGKQAGGAADAKATQVSLTGTVEGFACPMAAKHDCTGYALVVGETRHMIKKAEKGPELVAKAKGGKTKVKVKGTQAGEFLTVASYEITPKS